MGNQVSIYPTKFVSMDIDGNTTDESYGLRVIDSEDSTYENNLERHQIVGRLPAEIVQLAREMNPAAADMIEFAEMNLDGIEIGDTFYTWDEIKPKSVTP